MHSVAGQFPGVDPPADLPTLEDAERVASRSWPELAAAIRARRAMAAGAEDPARLRLLAADLPDPSTMRDVTNASVVAQARAHVLALDGDVDAAAALLRRMIDRGFKGVNDRLGHSAGDEALARVAAALQLVLLPEDTCARYGGDEFVVVRPAGVPGLLATDLAAAALVADRAPELRTSIGVTTTGDEPVREALGRADELMYAAKQAGGGRLVTG